MRDLICDVMQYYSSKFSMRKKLLYMIKLQLNHEKRKDDLGVEFLQR